MGSNVVTRLPSMSASIMLSLRVMLVVFRLVGRVREAAADSQ